MMLESLTKVCKDWDQNTSSRLGATAKGTEAKPGGTKSKANLMRPLLGVSWMDPSLVGAVSQVFSLTQDASAGSIK